MKRKGFLLAAAGVLLLAGWMLHRAGWFSRSAAEAASIRSGRGETADPLTTPAGWRYREHQPHHWRYVVLEQK
jgi:hypothetical protein